jgi:RNA polymerase sigma factor (sigma-70 family)
MVIDYGSDEAVMSASVSEPAKFEVIFERRMDGIYRYLSFRVGEALAEDLTAETFARAFASRNRYQPDRGSVSAWLYGIATNLVRNHRRDERRQMEMMQRANAGIAGSSADSSSQLAERLRLRSALASIDTSFRNVVLLIGVGGLSYEETAAALHIPIGTVRSRYSRARALLVASLGETLEPRGTRGEAL